MTENFLRLTTDVAPEYDQPAPDKILSGAPEFTTWNVEDRDGIYCGTWRATPGKWLIQYDEWEYCKILEGHSILTEDGGESFELKAGDGFVIRRGFKGTWEVVETTIKEYVIQT